MRTSYATMALKVTPSIEDEGAEVEGAEEPSSWSVTASIEVGPRSIIR